MTDIHPTKDYLERHNLDQTYWGKKIIAAEKRGGFTSSNREQSNDWVTCACGRITQDIPRENGCPHDLILSTLGSGFYNKVNNNEIDKAAEYLVEIEARAITVSIANAKKVNAK